MADTTQSHGTEVPHQRTVKAQPVPALPAKHQFHGFVNVTGRGLVAIPAELRKRYLLDEPGAQVEIVEREDGVLELRPTIAVPASDAWFWDKDWQAGERQAELDMVAGNFQTFDGPEAFLAHLDDLAAE